MSYPAIEYLASPNHSSRDGAKITMIVLHATVGSYASALAWLRNPQPKNPKARVSSHYLIRKDGYIAQLVADDRAAWHAGPSSWRARNSAAIQACSLSIELENANTGSDPYPATQLESCRLLCRSLVGRYSIARADIARHLDIAIPKGRKNDPAGFPWSQFVESVYTAPPAPTMPAPAGRQYDVLGLPVYQRPDRTGQLWGYLLAGEHVTVDSSGHLLDGRGWIDIRGCVTRPQDG